MTGLYARLAPGRAAFNRGEFFAAHELWEDIWRTLTGSDRTLVQGLIQIAAGLHHLQQDRQAPAARVLARGAKKLAGDAPGLPIAALLRDVQQLLATLETSGGHEAKEKMAANRIRF